MAMASSLKIQGRKGRFENFINGTYESTGSMHNSRPMWVNRASQPCYLYHNGKSRWVVSKQLDSGDQCFTFLQDTGSDPLSTQGSWVCPDTDGEWRSDTNMNITAGAPPANDKFSQLRTSSEAELEKYGLTNPEKLKSLWKRLDYNGNNVVSLAEIDKLVVEMVAGKTWPEWLNNKPALMRAYKKTILKDGDGDDWVQKHEFSALLLNIFWFNKLWLIFQSIDTGADRRIDVGEFTSGLAHMGLRMSREEAQAEFNKMDNNKGGQVLFVEFCCWVRNRINPDHNAAFDADIYSGEHCGKAMRQKHGNRGTHVHYVPKKTASDFDRVEEQIKEIMRDNNKLRDLWHNVDFNGNNLVSLAELDKMTVETFPLLNHKPALMRAYKATCQAGDGDEWVQKHEFKSLLGNILYFNKLFWMFEKADSDTDRRLNFAEFKQMLCVAGAMAQMSDAQAQSDFRRLDANGGGIILFDEFCSYFTAKMCPESLTAFVDHGH